jgi:hypothetical protein
VTLPLLKRLVDSGVVRGFYRGKRVNVEMQCLRRYIQSAEDARRKFREQLRRQEHAWTLNALLADEKWGTIPRYLQGFPPPEPPAA